MGNTTHITEEHFEVFYSELLATGSAHLTDDLWVSDNDHISDFFDLYYGHNEHIKVYYSDTPEDTKWHLADSIEGLTNVFGDELFTIEGLAA